MIRRYNGIILICCMVFFKSRWYSIGFWNKLVITVVCCENIYSIQQNADISHIYIQKIVVTIKARPIYNVWSCKYWSFWLNNNWNHITLEDSMHFFYFSAVGDIIFPVSWWVFRENARLSRFDVNSSQNQTKWTQLGYLSEGCDKERIMPNESFWL